jgi:AcrR family transcriptional regulator
MNTSADGGRPENTVRDKIVRGAAQLIRAQGVSNTGMRDVVVFADAPRGSLQHYFPGGKDQLVREALLWSGDASGLLVQHLYQGLDAPSPGKLLEVLAKWWQRELLRSGFDAGCPLVAAAVEVAASSDAMRNVIGEALDRWQSPIVAALEDMGVPRVRASSLAIVMLSALEGAIVVARIRHDVAPLDIVVEELTPMLDRSCTQK